MYAYIDESGNTGMNLFDLAQPYFFHVAMSSPVDFDSVFQQRIDSIAHTAGVHYLHASELGESGVESIARELIDLVEFSQARFHFAFVVKRDSAAIKFYDAIFDSGENPAAPITYGTRLLRLGLLLKFATLLEFNDAKTFWQAMTSSHSVKAESVAVSVIDNVLQRIDTLPDSRSRELIGDTLCWARNNIGEFSFWSWRKSERYGQLPNLYTLPQLFSGIYKSAKIWDDKVEKIIHDQQGQFSGTLRQWHSLFEGFDHEPVYHFGDTPIQFADIRDSEFEIGDSKVSSGLQLVDIVLWIFSRFISNRSLGPFSSELLDLCFSGEDFFYLSLDWIAEEVEYMATALMNRAITEEQLNVGKQRVERLEKMRQYRIRNFERRTGV